MISDFISEGNNGFIQITSNFNHAFNAMNLSHVFIFRVHCSVVASLWSFVHPKMKTDTLVSEAYLNIIILSQNVVLRT